VDKLNQKKWSLLLPVIAVLIVFSCIGPQPASAASTEPINFNVYVPTELNNWPTTVHKAIGTSWDVSASNGKATVSIAYSSKGGGLYHYKANVNSDASSTGWKVTVKYKPDCTFLGLKDVHCTSYNLVSSAHTLYLPSRWDVKLSGVYPFRKASNPTWTPVSGQRLRSEPDKSGGEIITPGPGNMPYIIKGVLSYSASTRKFSIKPTSGSSLIIGNNLGVVMWTSLTDAKKVGTTYSCNYFGTTTKPTDIFCNKGDVPPPNVPDPGGGAATTPDAGSTPAEPTGGPAVLKLGGFTLPGLTLDASQCPAGSTTFTSGILKDIPCDGAVNSLEGVLTFVRNIVQVFLLPLVGTLFIIMLLVGGVLYITSRGNQTQLDRAKKTLTAAIIGLLIVILSYTIIAIFARTLGGEIQPTTGTNVNVNGTGGSMTNGGGAGGGGTGGGAD